MPRWEYRFVDTDSDSWDALEKDFQEMGNHGWEFVGRVERIVTAGSSQDSLFIPALPHIQHRYLFKRERDDSDPSFDAPRSRRGAVSTIGHATSINGVPQSMWEVICRACEQTQPEIAKRLRGPYPTIAAAEDASVLHQSGVAPK